MNTCKRVNVYDDGHGRVVTPDPKGRFVKYEDYQALEELLESAWDAGYDSGKDSMSSEHAWIYTESFIQWKERNLK